jgi:hypothetical protein
LSLTGRQIVDESFANILRSILDQVMTDENGMGISIITDP